MTFNIPIPNFPVVRSYGYRVNVTVIDKLSGENVTQTFDSYVQDLEFVLEQKKYDFEPDKINDFQVNFFFIKMIILKFIF